MYYCCLLLASHSLELTSKGLILILSLLHKQAYNSSLLSNFCLCVKRSGTAFPLSAVGTELFMYVCQILAYSKCYSMCRMSA